MKTYLYQRNDGRQTRKRFTSDATALKFLHEILDNNWQLLTPLNQTPPAPSSIPKK